ncbi:hypothetical protein O1R50_04055 [Glycomyces luteolus]|uniref:Uncharacterized protein n=1 Tax=Glycomyces luteolus TaxID=2670330 RepID=A0A9X3SPB3_9ACTN|nr:hypothetical protein [Glycomyces luteolus]MDA1358781.1 hypothetical protein [Glycomyces luteolus]
MPHKANDKWVIRGVLQSAAADWTSSYEILGIAEEAARRKDEIEDPTVLSKTNDSSDHGKISSAYGHWDAEIISQVFNVTRTMLSQGLVNVGVTAPFVTWPGNLEDWLHALNEIELSLASCHAHDDWFDLEITEKGILAYDNRMLMIASKLILSEGVNRETTLMSTEVSYRNTVYGFDDDDRSMLHQRLSEQIVNDPTQILDSIVECRDRWWEDNRKQTIRRSIACLNHLISLGLIYVANGGSVVSVIEFPESSTQNDLLQWQANVSSETKIQLSDLARHIGLEYLREPLKDRVNFMTSEWSIH